MGYPLDIFDIVNAIDDDHRDGNRRSFFLDSQLNDGQFILTLSLEHFCIASIRMLGARRTGIAKRDKFLRREANTSSASMCRQLTAMCCWRSGHGQQTKARGRGLGAFPVAEGCQCPVDSQPGVHHAHAEAPRRPLRDMV
jgi:hypothetical protein